MSEQVEHFIHGASARPKPSRAALPAAVQVGAVPARFILREALPAGLDSTTATARIVALALASC